SKLLKDKNEIIGSDLNSKTLQDKENEAEKVSNLIENNSQLFKAKNSVIISYKFDNNEKKFNLENIGEVKKEDIESAKEEYVDIKKDG
ncbi:HlyD family efflux transporter periplasmic adaptor subunit, partial [Faecalibacillus intestinalis]|uniref:HlyD family efflux transporter periplasmic adaptor subunit n=1 Tax=Faecalibacillus intestinalis TaxID=1982626 RepID=UPI001EDE6DF1